MEEIKINEYCRTEKGIIGKLKDQWTFGNNRIAYPEPEEWVIDINGKDYVINEADMQDNIENHSFNIKDLIEVGDIVEMIVNNKEVLKYTVDCEDDLKRLKNAQNIISILTKEQFNSNKYII